MLSNRNNKKIPIIILCSFLSSCAAPKVYYSSVKSPDTEGTVKFKFARSMISFDATRDKDGNILSYGIHSVPIAATVDSKYSIVGASLWQNWFVETNLDVVHRDNSDLIQQIGVAVTDKRIETIKTIASIATAAAAMAEGSNNPLPPQQIDAAEIFKLSLKKSDKTEACTHSNPDDGYIRCSDIADSKDPTWTIDILLSPLPKDSIPASDLPSDKPYTSHAFLYSACREATVTLKYNGKDYVPGVGTIQLIPTSIMVADPSALEALRFPDKGKVIAAASCGADSTSEASPVSSSFEVIDALLTQAKGVKDSIDKKNSPAAPAK